MSHVRQQTGPWTERVRAYLRFRRQLGYRLKSPEWDLLSLARFLEERGHQGPLTRALAHEWAILPHTSPNSVAIRLGNVRGFALHLSAEDARHEVPLPSYGPHVRRRAPCILSEAEVAQALGVAGRVRPRGFSARTHQAILGLLAATGLRCGEALGLMRARVDWAAGTLEVDGKGERTRRLPLHPTVLEALRAYAQERDAFFGRRATPATAPTFFLTTRGNPVRYHTMFEVWGRVRRELAWQARAPRPRIHDLRHTFAVRNLVRWARAGVDVERKVLALSTYLGHSSVACTYWYFTAVPELLEATGHRFADYARRGAPLSAPPVEASP